MATFAKLKIAGTWSGTLEASLEQWTVTTLRQEIARQSNCEDPSSIKLICTGRVLNDGPTSLCELGVKNNAKILASKVSIDQGKSLKQELMAEEQRASRLTRLKSAVAALAQRHADGSMPIEDYNIELENQRGEKVNMGSETDQKAIMMGMMLHTKGKQLIAAQEFKDALEVLQMGEEAFSLCDPKFLEIVDNVAILQIDMVWCYFMLRDINLLSVAGERLADARKGIERTYGKDASRLRKLQGSRSPQLALYLRLELLEGVAAFHYGDLKKSRAALTSAKAKFSKLQISDESLSLLLGMGYKEQEARRALKLNEQDVEGAINFLVDEKEKKAERRLDDLKRQMEIKEQKKYGKTPFGKAVDMQVLNALVSISFDRELAAEALRRNENDGAKALDELTNPETKSQIEFDIISRKRKRQQNAEARVSQLISMGFDRSRAIAAVNANGSTAQSVDELLGQMQQDNATEMQPDNTTQMQSDSTAAFDSAGSSALNIESHGPPSPDGDSPSSSRGSDRDVEMENDLAKQIDGRDAFSDYDIDDISREAEALNEYLTLLDSAMDGCKPISG